MAYLQRGLKKVFITPLDAVEDTDKEGLGTIRFEGNSIYKWVLYKEGTATLDVVAGDVVGYVAQDGYLASQVTADVTDQDGVGAGVIQAAITATDKYCWVQIKGPATTAAALTAGADGNALTVVGAGDKTLDVSAAVTDAVCAIAQDASAKKIICDFPF